jgi:ribosome biogenesis protein Tsr3
LLQELTEHSLLNFYVLDKYWWSENFTRSNKLILLESWMCLKANIKEVENNFLTTCENAIAFY